MEMEKGPLLKSRIDAKQEPTEAGSLDRSAAFITELRAWLGSMADYQNFKRLAPVYTCNASDYFNADTDATHHVVVFAVKQSANSSALIGDLSPESHIILGRQAKGRWEEGSLAMPMGKVGAEDYETTSDLTLGDALRNAASRELGEEVERRKVSGFFLVAGSYIDKNTNNVVHVVIEQIGEPLEGDPLTMSVKLPNKNEHSQMGWAPVAKLPTLNPIAEGTRFAMLVAIDFINQLNQQSKENGRIR